MQELRNTAGGVWQGGTGPVAQGCIRMISAKRRDAKFSQRKALSLPRFGIFKDGNHPLPMTTDPIFLREVLCDLRVSAVRSCHPTRLIDVVGLAGHAPVAMGLSGRCRRGWRRGVFRPRHTTSGCFPFPLDCRGWVSWPASRWRCGGWRCRVGRTRCRPAV